MTPGRRRELGVAAEVGDQRVVGVEDEAGGARVLRDGRRPLVGDALQLPVAVELVAEEVAQDDDARVEVVRDAWQPGLVHLEQAFLARLLEQRGGHAPGHVRPGPVVHRGPFRRAEGGRDHARRGRLAVRGADDRGAVWESRAQAGDRIRRHPQQQAARQRGPAAPSTRSTQPARSSRNRELRAEEATHLGRGLGARSGGAITSSARGSTRTVAGRSAMWSPSA